jgi:hypothetical protein
MDREYEVAVGARTLPKGPIDAELVLTTRNGSGDDQPVNVHLPLNGAIVDDVEATPPEVVFSPQPVGSDLEETITLGSLTARPFSVLGASSSQPGSSIEVYPDRSVFKQRVTNTGMCRGNITFDIQNQSGKRTIISLPTFYLGKAISGMGQTQQIGPSDRR